MSKKIMLQSAPRAEWTAGYNGIADNGPGTGYYNWSDPADHVSAGDIFADAVSGNDSNPGTQALPVKTLRKAVELADAAGVNVYALAGTYSEAVDCPAGVIVYAAEGAKLEYGYSENNYREITTPFTNVYRIISIDDWLYAVTDDATSVLQRTQDLSTWESVGTYSDTSAQIYGYLDQTGNHVIVIAQGVQVFAHDSSGSQIWNHNLTDYSSEINSFCFHNGKLYAAGTGKSSTGDTENVWVLNPETGWSDYIGTNDADMYPTVDLLYSAGGALWICGTIYDNRYYGAMLTKGVHIVRQYTTDIEPTVTPAADSKNHYKHITEIDGKVHVFYKHNSRDGMIVFSQGFETQDYYIVDDADGIQITSANRINGDLYITDVNFMYKLIWNGKDFILEIGPHAKYCIHHREEYFLQGYYSGSNGIRKLLTNPANSGTWYGWQITGGADSASLGYCDISGDVKGGLLDYSRQTAGHVADCQLEGAEIYRSGNISGCNIYDSIITRSGSVTDCTAIDSVITDNQLDADSKSSMTNCVLRQASAVATLTDCIDAPPLFRDPDADDYRPQMQSAGHRYNSPMIKAEMKPEDNANGYPVVLSTIRGPYTYSHMCSYPAADWQYAVSTDPNKEEKSLSPVQLQTQESPTGIIHQYSPGSKKTWTLQWDANTAGPDWMDQRQYLRWLYLSGKPFLFGHTEDGNNFATLLTFWIIFQTGDDLPENTVRIDPGTLTNDTTGLLHNGSLLDHTLDGCVFTGGYWDRPVRIVSQIGNLLTLDKTAEIFSQDYIDANGKDGWVVNVIGYMVQIDRRQSFDLQRAFYSQSTEVPESGYQLTLMEADRW